READGRGGHDPPQTPAQRPAGTQPPPAGAEQAPTEHHPDGPLAAMAAAAPLAGRAAIPPLPAVPLDVLPLLDSAGDVRPLGKIEAELIRYAIAHYRGQISEVARPLQIGRSTLYRKLETLGLHGGGDGPGAEGVAAERQPRKIA